MHIVPLEPRHEAALARFLTDFHAAGESEIPGWFADPAWSHARTVEKVNAWAVGQQLPSGWLPCTTLFVEQGDELLGVVNLRQRLDDRLRRFGGHVGYAVRPSARRMGVGTKLLNGALAEGGRLGIESFLLTCAPDNHGSIGVILSCGGVFVDEFFHEGQGRAVRRYRIERPLGSE